MEEVLDLYEHGVAPSEVLICLDEKPLTLHSDKYPTVPCQPGQPARQDYEYKREGTCCLFMMFAPQLARRHVQVRTRKTMADFTQTVLWLAEDAYPQASKIHIVCDNLNTHKPGAFYKSLPATKAAVLRRRIVFHYTPKHASWLNMAEIELSVASNQCLGKRRIDSEEKMRQELEQWAQERNAKDIGVDWKFTSSNARTKLKPVYDSLFMS